MNVIVTLTEYPTAALVKSLTTPIPSEEGEGQLFRTAGAPGTTSTVLGGPFDGTLAELAAFFQSIPVGAYGTTQGIVCVEGAEPGLIVNRIGWVPQRPADDGAPA